MSVADTMHRKLTERFAPEHIQIVDESERHRGHAGWQPGGETHFHVEIVSDAFAGMSRVARQRAVYDALADEIAAGVHALTLTTVTPEEAR